MDIAALSTLWWILFRDRGARAPSPAPAPGPMPATGPDPAAAAAAAQQQQPYAPPQQAPAQAPTPMPGAAALPTLPWPSGPVPATLPPFPGAGWEPDTPVTPDIVTRAKYWNALLWDYSTKTQRKPFVQENFGGEWVTFAAAWHPGDKGPKTYMATEAWRVKRAPGTSPAAYAPPANAPAQAPAYVPAAAPGAAPPAQAPPMQQRAPLAAVQPYPGPGAWKSNAPYVKRYQAALAALGYYHGNIDGDAGPLTQGAVKAFQTHAGVSPIDGQAGGATAAALDAAIAHATT